MKAPLCKVDEIPAEGAKTLHCMHLGGPLRREGCTLVCDWHAAEFECAHGTRLKGPARPDSRLIILPTVVEHGVLTYVYGE